MASRPFASIAVALEVGGDQEELLQVSMRQKTQRRQKQIAKDDTLEHKREIMVICCGKKHDTVSGVVCLSAYSYKHTNSVLSLRHAAMTGV